MNFFWKDCSQRETDLGPQSVLDYPPYLQGNLLLFLATQGAFAKPQV